MNISFALTTAAVRHGFETGEVLKDVTRRLGWRKLKPGRRLKACRKCQWLRPGEKLDVLGEIEVVSVGIQRLDEMIRDAAYGREEVKREGFPEMTAEEFVAMFCKHMKCTPAEIVTRIEFRYVRT